MFNNTLIGSQLVYLDKYGFVVKMQNGDLRHFEFDEDNGDCCGYNDLSATLYFDENEYENNPVITSITEEAESYECEHKVFTFFGGNKLLAQIDSKSGSGSGWCYGACVTCKCFETKEEENLTSW